MIRVYRRRKYPCEPMEKDGDGNGDGDEDDDVV